jgi:hypothetical protein
MSKQTAKSPSRSLLLFLAILTGLGAVTTLWTKETPSVLGMLVLQPVPLKEQWRTIEVADMEEGATVPADTNVIFHMPLDADDTYRETLLGNRGKEIRYWGYCFPAKDDPADPPQSNGFPGRLFLSEAERAYRTDKTQLQVPRYSIFRPPTRAQLTRDATRATNHGEIRHEVEIFRGGMTCYIMTQEALPIGLDRDNDGLNSQLEKQYGTDPLNPDTDIDGAIDGSEVFNLHTDPLNPDTDGDGLTDGIEVHGHERVMPGDTDPLNPDSDHDGLCDGYCRVDRIGQFCTAENKMRCIDTGNQWTGEDRNLDGVIDDKENETNPTKWSTADDGISDSQKFYQCLLDGKKDC